MEEQETGLNEMIVKTAAWAHNTNVNRAGFSPLTLVTGKAVQVPGLTMGNVASECHRCRSSKKNTRNNAEDNKRIQRSRNENEIKRLSRNQDKKLLA